VSGAKDSALALLHSFKAAFDAPDPVALAKLFASEAVFLGTSMAKPTRGRDAVLGYFQKALSFNLPKRIDIDGHELLTISDAAVVVSGHCTYSQTVNGKTDKAPARFTFVMVKDGERWRIGHFHSSMAPA
jgi:uncharacterized protein (TIGR02246 family)